MLKCRCLPSASQIPTCPPRVCWPSGSCRSAPTAAVQLALAKQLREKNALSSLSEGAHKLRVEASCWFVPVSLSRNGALRSPHRQEQLRLIQAAITMRRRNKQDNNSHAASRCRISLSEPKPTSMVVRRHGANHYIVHSQATSLVVIASFLLTQNTLLGQCRPRSCSHASEVLKRVA